MHNNQLQNASDNPVLDQPDTAVMEDPDLLSPEELQLQRLGGLAKEVHRLYAWLGLLTGLSVLSLGLLTGFTVWLKVEQNQLQRQLAAINAYKAETDRVKNLESRVNGLETQASLLNQNVGLLNQQVPKGLATQIKGIQKDMSSLKSDVQNVKANAVTRDQVDQSIQRTLKEQNKVVNPSPLPTR